MEPRTDCEPTKVEDVQRASDDAPRSSGVQVHILLRARLDSLRYTELFWEEA